MFNVRVRSRKVKINIDSFTLGLTQTEKMKDNLISRVQRLQFDYFLQITPNDLIHFLPVTKNLVGLENNVVIVAPIVF